MRCKADIGERASETAWAARWVPFDLPGISDAANMNRRTGDRSRGLCNGKEAADGTELSKLW
jgi:hypothetical protein